jgi:hypothetical protein
VGLLPPYICHFQPPTAVGSELLFFLLSLLILSSQLPGTAEEMSVGQE